MQIDFLKSHEIFGWKFIQKLLKFKVLLDTVQWKLD